MHTLRHSQSVIPHITEKIFLTAVPAVLTVSSYITAVDYGIYLETNVRE